MQRCATLLAMTGIAMSACNGIIGDRQKHSTAATTPIAATVAVVAPPPVFEQPSPVAHCAPDHVLLQLPWPEHASVCTTSDGARDGDYVSTFPNGHARWRGSFVAGKRDGNWQRFYADGQLADEGAYAGGLRDGAWHHHANDGRQLPDDKFDHGTGVEHVFTDDGVAIAELPQRAGIFDGNVHWLNKNGEVVVEETWRHGKLDGPRRVGGSGSTRVEEHYSNGVRTGPRKIFRHGVLAIDETFDSSGDHDGSFTAWRDSKYKREEGTFVHGHRDGVWTWFDSEGKKEREGSYVKGRRDGVWTEWNDKTVTWTGAYKNGAMDGTFIVSNDRGHELGRFEMTDGAGDELSFHPDKKVASTTHWRNSHRDGDYEERYPRGKVAVRGHYSDDRLSGHWQWFTTEGTVRREVTYRSNRRNGAFAERHGKVVTVDARFTNGARDGAYIENFNDGTPAVRGQFVGDARDGQWQQFYPDGKVAVTEQWSAGVLDGAWEQLAPDGSPRLRGSYAKGHRVGTWETFGPDGKLIKTEDFGK